jgi:hypothetical protein
MPRASRVPRRAVSVQLCRVKNIVEMIITYEKYCTDSVL